jgi:hypothetical protein
MRHVRLLIALAAIFVGSILVDSAAGDSAAPYPQSSCSITAFGGVYQGTGTALFQNCALVLVSCSARLVSGTAVSQTMRTVSGNCVQVVTPASKANLVCTKS